MPARLRAVLLFLVCSSLVVSAFAQTNPTTGQIAGRVTDNTGTGLPGVTLTASNVNTGLTRTTVTEDNGQYVIALLPPGTYRLTAELAGLGTANQERVSVLLGTSSTANLSLSPSMAEEITVTAAAPVVDVRQSGLTEAVTETEIENLPILGRDFKDLVLLTPGATEAFGGRVALNGARGVGTDYNIDGAEANSEFFGEERGGTEAPFVFSQAAIREFQVIRSTYSAEYSRGVGATMNAITKSGTNEFDGEAFWYLRDADWADTRSATLNGEETGDDFESRNVDQYGAAVGGPIVHDRFHFFVATDLQDVTEPMNLFDVRDDPDFRALTPEVQAAFISRVEGLLGHSLDEEYSLSSEEDQETYLVKLDGNFGTSHHASARWNFADFNNFPSEGFQVRSANGDEYNTSNSVVVQAESVLANTLFNQFIFQWGLEERPINSLAPAGLPNTGISGRAPFTFGRSEFLPNATDEEKFQIKNNLSYAVGSHHFKVGIEYVDGHIDNFFPREAGGEYDFNSIQAFVDNEPSRFFQGYGPTNGLNSWDFSQWGAFLQDTWSLGDLTLDLGVRYDIQDIPEPVANKFPAHPEFVENFENDDDNWAPRLGFAWDIGGNSRSVLRGGVGVFYQPIPNILYAGPLAEVGGIYNRISVTCTTDPETNPCPDYPNIFSPEEFAEFVRAAPDVTGVNSDLEAMQSTRMSLGFEQQVGSSMSVGLEGVYSEIEDAWRLVNVNAGATGLMYGDLVVYSTSNDSLQAYPEFRDVKLHTSDAEGTYKAVTLQARRLPTGNSRFSWVTHYTWSEAIDQDSNERSTSTSFHLDPFNREVSEGPADYDIEQRFLASGTYELPWGIMVSGILNWRTGSPYTAGTDTGRTSLNGLFGLGVSVPVFRDSSGNVIDLTQASGMTPAQFSEFLAGQGATMEGRNQRRQPDFMNIDLRLSKRFSFGQGVGIELIGEVFNVLNEENTFITSSNQSMFFGSFSRSTGAWTFTRNESFGQENSFAGLPRQYQAAIKLLF